MNCFSLTGRLCSGGKRFDIAYVAGVKRGRGRGNLGARGRKERNACKDAIVFSVFHAQILSVKIVIGQN